MKKFLVSLILSISLVFAIGTVLATERLDLVAPKGMISLSTGTIIDGIYHVNTPKVTLQLSATDNVSKTNDLMMIISDQELTGEYLANDNHWESFKSEYEYTLPSLENMNYVYLYLKDEVGNISPSIKTGVTKTFTVTFNAGSGDGAPSARNAEVGMHFIVPAQIPTLDDYYFIGWSLIEGGDVQYEPYSVITSKYLKGDITFYAVWTDNVKDLPTLAEKVGIGDYVNYPVAYENVVVGSEKAMLGGWRVLSIEKDANGDDYVNIVSAGVPLTYYHSNNSSNSVKNLTTNLTNIPFSETGDAFRENGFITNDLNEVFNNRFTQKYKANELASYNDSVIGTVSTTRNAGEFKVRLLTKEDLDKVYDKTGVNKIASGTALTETNLGKLLAVPSSTSGSYAKYYIGSANSSNSLWNVNNNGNVGAGTNEESGVRLVVSLKASVRTTFEETDGVWEILDEGVHVGDYINYAGTGSATLLKGVTGTSADQTINAASPEFSDIRWRVISVDGNEVKIIPEKPLGMLTLQGHIGAANAVDTINSACKAFINSSLRSNRGQCK